MKLSLFKTQGQGQGLVEYALVLAVVAIIVIATYPVWGPSEDRMEAANEVGTDIANWIRAQAETTSWTVLQPQDLKNGVPQIPWKIHFEGILFMGHCQHKEKNGDDMYWFTFQTDDQKQANRYGFPTKNCLPPILNSFVAAIDEWVIICQRNNCPEAVTKSLENFANLLIH